MHDSPCVEGGCGDSCRPFRLERVHGAGHYVPLEPIIDPTGLGCSMELTECLTALEWGIPLDRWWGMSRWLRAMHIATIQARSMIMKYMEENS